MELKNESEWGNVVHLPKETKVDTTVCVLSKFLPKKAAALEVAKEVNIQKWMGISLIAGVMVVAVSGTFNAYAGAGAAGIFSILAAFAIKRSVDRIKYFQKFYNINPQLDEGLAE